MSHRHSHHRARSAMEMTTLYDYFRIYGPVNSAAGSLRRIPHCMHLTILPLRSFRASCVSHCLHRNSPSWGA